MIFAVFRTPKVILLYSVYCTAENFIGGIIQMVTRMFKKQMVLGSNLKQLDISPFLYVVECKYYTNIRSLNRHEICL